VHWSRPFPIIIAFAQQRRARLPHPLSLAFLTGPRFDASAAFAHAPAPRVARLSTRPTPFRAAETFTPELSSPQVTPQRSRVSLRSCLDSCCGGTCIRWERAVLLIRLTQVTPMGSVRVCRGRTSQRPWPNSRRVFGTTRPAGRTWPRADGQTGIVVRGVRTPRRSS
jgi:hypothetical protein